jgi:hypothetical protein
MDLSFLDQVLSISASLAALAAAVITFNKRRR